MILLSLAFAIAQQDQEASMEAWKACAVSASARLLEDGAEWKTAAYGALDQCKKYEDAFARLSGVTKVDVEVAKARVAMAMRSADANRSYRGDAR
ncbi:hypothetical protein ACMGDH_13405 [Sphingomonas sp. DT-207]|uniref:hypothetical protein n=1 Tax=Sphingomonas sp. DT-207 TaxID=3396167 RepID=UPI003F1D3492